jgi:hypothetical protein
LPDRASDGTAAEAKLSVEEHVTTAEQRTFSVERSKLHLFDAETGRRKSG